MARIPIPILPPLPLRSKGKDGMEEETTKTSSVFRDGLTPVYLEIVAHLNQVAGKSFKHTSEVTRKYIRARLAEGFTVDDFKKVHELKWAEWKGTEWEKFVCPTTLYRPSNFERYLNQTPETASQASDMTEFGIP